MGPNATGKNDVKDYNLGRGIVYFATLLSTGVPGEYRDLGNSTEFNLTVDKEVLQHFSSREGLKQMDREVTISQGITIASLVLDEINHENLALLLSGGKASHTNVAIAGFVEYEWIASVTLGRWYDIVNSAGERAYNIDATDVDLDVGATDLVEDTDYELDLTMGRVFFLTAAANVATGNAVDLTLAAKAGAGGVDEVRALTNETIRGALKFVAENPANADEQSEYQFHSVALKADGDIALISDDWQTMTFTGAAERNADADADSPTLTIRTLAT